MANQFFSRLRESKSEYLNFERQTNNAISGMKSLDLTATILVPVDFSDITKPALVHAELYATIFKKPITLVHLIDKGWGDKEHELKLEEEEALSKLQNFADDISNESGIEVSVLVRRGDFHEGIGELAEELNATLVVMGTKGIKGLQRWTGSHAMKVIKNTKDVPFIVVQDMPKRNDLKTVVLPFSFTVESRQKLAWAIHIAKMFQCHFLLLAEHQTDEFIQHKMQNNITFAKKYLDQHGCSYSVETASGSTAFHKEIIIYASAKDADLILIMTDEDREFTEYFTGTHEQDIIANEKKIPVMVMNPVDNMQILGAAMFQ
jgi:nucleotide-binding universal stress UspA family protein